MKKKKITCTGENIGEFKGEHKNVEIFDDLVDIKVVNEDTNSEILIRRLAEAIGNNNSTGYNVELMLRELFGRSNDFAESLEEELRIRFDKFPASNVAPDMIILEVQLAVKEARRASIFGNLLLSEDPGDLSRKQAIKELEIVWALVADLRQSLQSIKQKTKEFDVAMLAETALERGRR